MIRVLRVVATGQYLAASLTQSHFQKTEFRFPDDAPAEEAVVEDDGSAWLNQVAEEYNLEPADLRLMTFDNDEDDPRPPDQTKWLHLPSPEPSVEEAKAQAQAEYDAAVNAKLREQAVQALAAEGIHPPK